jgi:hypothetical protein
MLGDQRMDFVQQTRHALHFINDHPVSSRPTFDLLAKRFRLTAERQQGLCSQQIEPQRVRKNLFQPRGLARAARAKQEERVVGQGLASCNHGSKLTVNLLGVYTKRRRR